MAQENDRWYRKEETRRDYLGDDNWQAPQNTPLNGRICPCCNGPAKNRGVCHATYAAARRLVIKGETTWGELIRAGKILPSRQGMKPGSTRSLEYLRGAL